MTQKYKLEWVSSVTLYCFICFPCCESYMIYNSCISTTLSLKLDSCCQNKIPKGSIFLLKSELLSSNCATVWSELSEKKVNIACFLCFLYESIYQLL